MGRLGSSSNSSMTSLPETAGENFSVSIPLMVTEKCVGKELSDCEQCQSGKLELTDRRRVRFPILQEWKHRSLIMNSVPIWMADRSQELIRMGLTAQHFIFTTETEEQIRDMIRSYQIGNPPKGDIRRIR